MTDAPRTDGADGADGAVVGVVGVGGVGGVGQDDAPSDDELLAAHVSGDPAAFAVLVRRHQDRLWGVATRTLRDREAAADALQDALVKAHRGAAGFRGDAAVSTWLHRIVVNACLDQLRRGAARPVSAAEPAVLERADLRTAGADLGDDVARRVDVERALAALPVEQRAALVLVDLLGHDVETAASILDCPVGTVKSRCARGRARLAPLLDHLRTARPPCPSNTRTAAGRTARPRAKHQRTAHQRTTQTTEEVASDERRGRRRPRCRGEHRRGGCCRPGRPRRRRAPLAGGRGRGPRPAGLAARP